MPAQWERSLDRWRNAGLLDAATSEQIRLFESKEAESGGLNRPVIIALILGGMALAAGVLLFVAAHWENLSPSARFSLVLLLVAMFHIAGAFSAPRFAALATTFHGLGTMSLGAGIFLAGQIFNLQEHWPDGVLLWAVGAIVGWLLLRDTVQAILAALLVPAWLISEWIAATQNVYGDRSLHILSVGLLLLGFVYFGARTPDYQSSFRKALTFIGGATLLPSAIAVVATAKRPSYGGAELLRPLETVGWTFAIVVPAAAGLLLRRRRAWIYGLTTLWVLVLAAVSQPWEMHGAKSMVTYFWCGIGSVGVIAWGVYEQRRERINLGLAGFALTVLGFYFSTVMDRLDRSVALITLGILFLGGGWLLERTRRRLIKALESPK
jgi:uncharacterized membrane protein